MNSDLRRNTLTPILLSILALIVGLVGQGYFADPVQTHALKPTDGLIVWAVAVLIAVLAVARTPPLAQLSSWAGYPPSGVLTLLRLVWAAAFFGLSGLFTLLSLSLFGNDTPGSGKWWLHLAAIGLFLLAAVVLTGRERPRLRLSAAELLCLAFILVVALFFRLYRFGELPYGLWYDEADNGLWARQLLNDPLLRPIYADSTNLPAHFLYLVMFSFRLFGDGMWSIRLVAVGLGLLTVVAAYFCGRELFDPYGIGRAIGLFMAFLLAVSRWDVTWSRIGMHGVTVPLFELWTLAALLRGLRTGRVSAFAWAGVALGLGLCFYSALRVFPVILVAFGLSWLVQWLKSATPADGLGKALRRVWAVWAWPALVFAVGVLIAFAPVAQFAIHQPQRFWARANKISVFNETAAQADPLKVLGRSTFRHLLMFNYEGDPNGRHNLPGAPMLDRLSGVLFVFGVVVALRNRRDPRALVLIVWLLLSLSGGILTVSFESPQSLRSIGAMPAAYGLVCLALSWFVETWQRVFGMQRIDRLVWPAVVLAAGIGILEGWTYFGLWAHDFASWAAFNPAETRMAQDINLYRERYDLWFDPLLTAHLSTRYLAPDYTYYQHFDPATVFPIPGASKEGVILFVSPDTFKVREEIQRLYPDVQMEEFTHPESGRAVMYRYIVNRELISSVQGLDASFISLDKSSSEALYRVERQIDFNWHEDDPPVSYPFQAIWSGGLLAQRYGVYTLYIDAPDQVLLSLDGEVLFNGVGPQSRRVVLAQGVHAFYLDCTVNGPGAVRLRWSVPWDVGEPQPVNVVSDGVLYRSFWPTNGLVGRFYAGGDLNSEPAIVRIDRQLAYYFHFLPLPRPYRVEWSGRLLAPMPGLYRLGLKAIGAASLYVDGQWVVESEGGQYQDAQIKLTTGLHDLHISFLDDRDRSQIYLYWQVPGEFGPTLIGAESLFLPATSERARGPWWDAQ